MKHLFIAVVGLAISAGSLAAELPNVVFLSVDTLRADRLGAYGYEHDTTPHLDAFAETGLLFEDAVCEIPLTSPSFVSMLSGRFPRLTGTTRNGLRVPDSTPLVAEQFQAAGYYTFGVQSNWTVKDRLSGLGRGFDRYDDGFHKKRWGVVKAERDGDDVTRLALEYLEQRDPEKPFFAWIHYADPHAPYRKHSGFNPSGKRPSYFNKQARVRNRYDSEVAFTDNEIQKILEALPENTRVLFVGDHGESLFEHDYLGHGRRIYQTMQHIPLIIRGEGIAAGRSKVPARGIDIAPTLLGLAGLPKPETMMGLDLIHDTVPMDRVRVFETYGGAVPNIPGVKSAMADAGPIRQGIILEGWKLIVNGKDKQLYYLPEDPGELNNLSQAEPDRVNALLQQIRDWEIFTPLVEEGTENLSADDLKALESLGYLD